MAVGVEVTGAEISPKIKVDSPLHMKFEDITVKIDDKYILQNVYGEVKPGEILAIMGPSGSGKTTLLNILAGRNFGGVKLETGSILINDKPADKQSRRKMGYVLQEDAFLSHLTVHQTLQFVGSIVLSDSLTKAKKSEIIDAVVDELSLNKCLNTVIGGGIFQPGCSGGEKKRTGIASEMIKNPSMLMLDEPTSGLDASNACSLIKSVRRLAKEQHRAVAASIHQPSSHVFHMFDKLLLLCNGKVAYFGRTDRVLNFFEWIELPCYPNWNPADFILEKLTNDDELEKRIVEKFEEYKKSDSDNTVSENINDDEVVTSIVNKGYSPDEIVLDDTEREFTDIANNDIRLSLNPSDSKPPVEDQYIDDADDPKWPTSFQTQFLALSRRSFIQIKNSMLDRFAFAESIGIAIGCIIIWFDTPYDEASISDRSGVIFFLTMYIILNPMFFGIMTFGPERSTFGKERAAGMYRLSAYFFAKNLSELPVVILNPVALYTLVYWSSGLNRSPVFLVGLLLILTIIILSSGIGYCVGSLIHNLRKTLCVCIIFALTSMIMGGFFTRRLPHWFAWARYFSHMGYAYNILHILEFSYATRTFRCAATRSVFEACKGNGTMVIKGIDIREKYKGMDLDLGESFAVLWGAIVMCRILFYISLRYMNRPK